MCLKQEGMHILWRSGGNHHDPWLDLELLHLNHELLVGVLLHCSSHDKPIFEELILLEEFLVTECFLNFEHSLLFFLILSSFLDNKVSILPGISLELKVHRMTFVFKHPLPERCIGLIGMVIVPGCHTLTNVLLQLDLLFLPLLVQDLLNIE